MNEFETAEVASLPVEYRPLGAWTYFGYSVLFSIPVVGLVFMFIYAFSNENINRRNFARSYFCMMLLAAIVAIVATIILATTGIALGGMIGGLMQ